MALTSTLWRRTASLRHSPRCCAGRVFPDRRHRCCEAIGLSTFLTFRRSEATSDDPVSRAAIEAGIRPVLFVALRNERGLLGYLTADRMEVRPFSEKEIGVMESFAAQAVIAMVERAATQ